MSASDEGRRAPRGLPRDERGASLAIVAIGMTVFIGMAALAVDLGMLFTARSQAQRTADAAALAGATVLATTPGARSDARAAAIDIASRNDVMGTAVVVQAGDVTFPQDDKVRVWVYRTAARGDPVNTIFARILGINSVDVSARAAAQVFPASRVDCVLPIMLPDQWIDNGGSPNAYDPGVDQYIPYDPNNPDAPHTAYDENDYGKQVVIRGFQNPGAANPSWYYPFAQPGMAGANDYRNGIMGRFCGGSNSPIYSIGDWVNTEPGAMTGPTKQGFRDLINQDPSAYWDPSGAEGRGCVAHPGEGCGSSPRVRPIPMFDPTKEPDPGRKPLQIMNFAGLFVESINGNNIVGRFLGFTGVDAGPAPGSGSVGGLINTIKLVE